MKIWFVLGAPEHLFGGGEVFAVRLARWLKIRGHDVEVVTRPDSLTGEAARKAFLKVRELPLKNDLDLKSRRRLGAWFNAENPDAVIGAWGRDIKLSARAARRAGARLFWLQGTVLSKNSRSHRRLDRNFLAGYFAPSEFTKQQLVERGGIEPDRVSVVYPAVNPKPFGSDGTAANSADEFRRAYNIPPDTTVALCLSRHVEIKGHAYLLEAWADIFQQRDNAILVIAGTGPLEAKLRSRVSELGMDSRVRFTGHIPDTRPALWNADILVVPSLEEPLGIVTLEAMAAGVAVVASDVGGIPEVVEDGSSGLLVPAGDATQLRDAILRLIDHSDYRMELVHNGKRRVERFSADNCFPIFESVVAGNHSEPVCA